MTLLVVPFTVSIVVSNLRGHRTAALHTLTVDVNHTIKLVFAIFKCGEQLWSIAHVEGVICSHIGDGKGATELDTDLGNRRSTVMPKAGRRSEVC